MDHILDKFDTLTANPVKYLLVQNEIEEDIKSLVKTLYDETKKEEGIKKSTKNALEELIVDDFDEEQIWQQIEMHNSDIFDQLVWQVSKCVSNTDALKFPIDFDEGSDNASLVDEDAHDSNKGEPLVSKDKVSTEVLVPTKASKNNYKSSIVDDKFFKLREMEEFLLKEEKMEDKKVDDDSDDEIDLFQSDDENSENEEEPAMYADFFGCDDQSDNNNVENLSNERIPDSEKSIHKDSKKVRFSLPSDEASDSTDSDESSSRHKGDNADSQFKNKEDKRNTEFEQRQQRLKQQISKLEDKSLSEAPWQLKGEIDATKRPQNSLLEEVLDFDLTSRPPPIITEETTLTLEEIIKRRIKDKAWDDVERKEKPVENQLAFKKADILDHSKSKMSLAQIYEAEYLKQKQALSGETEEEKEPEAHKIIRDDMASLFAKLDALCHYHYTPKIPQPDVKIVSNIPAISMEEVAPIAVSDAALLAPEEIKSKNKGDLMSKEERTKTDRNRERRKKKKNQRRKGETSKVTDNRFTKMASESKNNVKTSKEFFQQLNDNTTSLIKGKRNVKNKG